MAGHNQNSSQTQDAVLPSNRAFVVQFQGVVVGQTIPIAGRVEHVTSGHRLRFQSWEELQRFIEQELAQLEQATANSTSEEPEEI